MPLYFNTLLDQENIVGAEVRLLRHKDSRSKPGRSLYQLWREDRPAFDLYQSHHGQRSFPKLQRPYWASFVATPENRTLFVGLYKSTHLGLTKKSVTLPHSDEVVEKGRLHVYHLELDSRLKDLIGRVFIEWGEGALAWAQRAEKHNKKIIEIRTTTAEPEFPGFTKFIEPLSKISSLPLRWRDALAASRGVYLLTCPRTKEQYVGVAHGKGGFISRWLQYELTGHGGNVKLKGRDPSDYQVSILEIVGNTLSDNDLFEIEQRWMKKLQSKEMGLNR